MGARGSRGARGLQRWKGAPREECRRRGTRAGRCSAADCGGSRRAIRNGSPDAVRRGKWTRSAKPQRALLDLSRPARTVLPCHARRRCRRSRDWSRSIAGLGKRSARAAPRARRARRRRLDAPFMPRGDHLKPGESVPRGYLEVLGSATVSHRAERPLRAGGADRRAPQIR